MGRKFKRRHDIAPDATAAIQAARRGNCKTAFRHLHDAHPTVQTSNVAEQKKFLPSYRSAQIIVERLCTVDTKRAGRYGASYALQGARRRRKKR